MLTPIPAQLGPLSGPIDSTSALIGGVLLLLGLATFLPGLIEAIRGGGRNRRRRAAGVPANHPTLVLAEQWVREALEPFDHHLYGCWCDPDGAGDPRCRRHRARERERLTRAVLDAVGPILVRRAAEQRQGGAR